MIQQISNVIAIQEAAKAANMPPQFLFSLVTLLVATLVGCTRMASDSSSTQEKVLAGICTDLEVSTAMVKVLDFHSVSPSGTAAQVRDQAIVLDNSNGGFALRAAFRFPEHPNPEFRRWQWWVTTAIGEDGTGVESHFQERFLNLPTPEEVFQFKAKAFEGR